MALRDIRLRALADAPDAFGSTLEREAAFDDETWRDWAREAASGIAETCLLAWVDDQAAGIAGAYVEDGRDHAHLIAMWVASGRRRLGLGKALVEGVFSWTAETGLRAVRLDVGDDNVGARRLYESLGFTATGRTRRYDERPRLVTVELERAV